MKTLPDALRPLLLPYDPHVVGEHFLGEGQLIIPRVRCTEDRPQIGYRYSALPAGNEGQTALVMIPPRPDPEEFWTPEGMAANATRTGLSATGGLSGLIVAHTVAHIMKGLSAEQLPPTHFLDGVLDTCYPGLGENHAHCLGREKAPNVLRFAVEHPDDTLGASLDIAPWVDQGQFGRFIDSARAVTEHGSIFPTAGEVTATRLRPLRGTLENPDTPPPHAAEFIVAIGGTATSAVLWDTDEAWKSDTPGYALNTGALPTIFELVSSKIGGDPDAQVPAMVYFQGAATHLLPRPAGEPLDIYYI